MSGVAQETPTRKLPKVECKIAPRGLPKMKQRSYKVRLTDEELDRFEAKRQKLGLHAGHLVRLLINAWTNGYLQVKV